MIVLGATSCTKEELERFYRFCQLFSIRPSNSHGKSLKTSVTFSRYQHFLSKTNKLENQSPLQNPQIRTVTYCTRLSHPSHVKDSIPYSPIFSDSVGSAAKDSDFNSKCDENVQFSFPNVAIRTASCLKHSIGSKNVNRESALEPSASDNEERIPFHAHFSILTI